MTRWILLWTCFFLIGVALRKAGIRLIAPLFVLSLTTVGWAGEQKNNTQQLIFSRSIAAGDSIEVVYTCRKNGANIACDAPIHPCLATMEAAHADYRGEIREITQRLLAEWEGKEC